MSNLHTSQPDMRVILARKYRARLVGALFLGIIALSSFCFYNFRVQECQTVWTLKRRRANGVSSGSKLFAYGIIISGQGEEIPVQFTERDLVNYNLYHLEAIRQLPVFQFRNRNNIFQQDKNTVRPFDAKMPIIYVITPTYTRVLQKAELTRTCSALRHAKNIFWIVIEDTLQKTDLVTRFLKGCGIPAVHMNFKSYFEPHLTVDQRNAALLWIKRNINISLGHGVVYFADDDNAYDPEVFEEMRDTKKVSVWPVGFASDIAAEGPIVKDGKVVDWASGFSPKERKFPIDMAGFAFNVRMLKDSPDAKFQHHVAGFAETVFLESLGIEEEDLEPKADNCSKVLVWHTQAKQPRVGQVQIKTKRGGEVPFREV